MAVRKVSCDNVEVSHLPGRDMWVLVDDKTVGANNLSMGITKIHVGSEARPCHAHLGSEEVIYVLEGQGQAWVDGEVCDFYKGDAVFFPLASKHMIRNTGTTELKVVSFFAPRRKPDEYMTYDDVGCWPS